MSAGAYFRASRRRALVLPPLWVGRARPAPIEITGELFAWPAPCAVMSELASQPYPDWPDAPLPEEFEIPAGDNATADHGGGCEGSAPEGTSGALAKGKVLTPANADQRHAPRPVAPRPIGEKIDLAGVVSEMDRQAARSAQTRKERVLAEVARTGGELKVLCRCGASAPGAVHGLVPQWFGRDCIERDCALKVPA